MNLEKVRATAARIGQVNSLATELAFLLAFALAPLLGVTLGLAGRLLPTDISVSLVEVLQRVVPAEAHVDATEVVAWARSSASQGWVTVGFFLAVVTSFRFSSICVRSLATIVAGEARPVRHGWRSLLASLALLLVWVAALALTALFLFIGPYLERGLLGVPDLADQLLVGFSVMRALLVLLVLYLVVWITYRMAMPKGVRRLWLALSAAGVAIGWLAIGFALSAAVPKLWRATQLYGTLGSIVLFLAWAYLCAWLLLAGGLLVGSPRREQA